RVAAFFAGGDGVRGRRLVRKGRIPPLLPAARPRGVSHYAFFLLAPCFRYAGSVAKRSARSRLSGRKCHTGTPCAVTVHQSVGPPSSAGVAITAYISFGSLSGSGL